MWTPRGIGYRTRSDSSAYSKRTRARRVPRPTTSYGMPIGPPSHSPEPKSALSEPSSPIERTIALESRATGSESTRWLVDHVGGNSGQPAIVAAAMAIGASITSVLSAHFLSIARDRPGSLDAMTALSLPAPSALAAETPTAALRSGALLHRVRAAAVAVWRLAPGRYLAIPDGDEIVVMPLGGMTRIGRRATSDIVLDDATVSRRHALVLERDGAPVIADDRSLNGVFVNGARVREARLSHGDEVRIGDRIMRFLEIAPAPR